MALTITPYSDASFVVRGDTLAHKPVLDSYGKYNRNLQGGAGYIVSNKRLSEVAQVVADINDGKTVGPKTAVPRGTYKKVATVIPQKISSLPGAPVSVLPTGSTEVPSGKTQTLTYVVELPYVNQDVVIVVENTKHQTRVVQIKDSSDIIYLQFKTEGDDDKLIEAGVYAGQWQIRGEPRPHSLLFL